jgi:uncharacterized protein with PQ loop repeat
VTFFLLLTTSPESTPPNIIGVSWAIFRRVTVPSMQIRTWASFLGISSAVLAAIQYAPQIYHTYCAKLVAALSIKMMLIQTPGTIFMILSIALRYVYVAIFQRNMFADMKFNSPGTNWTSMCPCLRICWLSEENDSQVGSCMLSQA